MEARAVSEYSAEILAAIQEMRDLLRLMAEPAIAERDQKHRDKLRQIVGKSAAASEAVLLMNGTRKQAEIRGETGIHQGSLSELVKSLKEANLLIGDIKKPQLAIVVPASFFATRKGTQ
jgi:hypothetical protein